MDHHALAHDLLIRTENAVGDVCHAAVDTGITFGVSDIVDAVERGLPMDYPMPTAINGGIKARRDLIEDMACAFLSGDVYEQGLLD